jgi:tetratricopeptide (TPR) repeat protein
MARKKRQPPKKGPKPTPKKAPKKRARPEPQPPAGLPDRRAMEGVMRELLGELFGGPAADTPLGQAQQLVDEAFGEPDPKKRARLARQALDRSPDCADAYVLLAEEARTRKESLELYEQAVAAGERAIGPGAFTEDVGHFWGLLETRPYMRAREGLAHTLWTLRRREEAVEHLNDLLRLNPNDNQGLRYTLASWLLDLDRDDELARLLEQYDEDSATWAYTAALLAFRRQGDTPETRKQLKKAQKANKHVPAYLLGKELIPPEQPPYYSPGDKSEAIVYAAGGLSAWRSTPGALTWLREATGGTSRRKKAEAPPPAGPSAVGKARLKKLPREFDTWQADCRPVRSLVEHEGGMVQPWITLVASRGGGLVLAQQIGLEPPSAASMWDVLARAMGEPLVGQPRRPTELQVRPGPVWDELRPHLDDIGVKCAEADELDLIGFLVEDLARHLTREEPPGLLDVPGVTPERVAGFYKAAAEYYRQAPWKRLGYEEAIRVECDRYESGPGYAVVMGQSGMTLGVALYEDLDLLRRIWAGELSDEENARQTVSLAVTFDPEVQLPTADLLAMREHGWEVAGPEAYPSVFRKERGLSMRPPVAWELELLEGCLRAIPEFVSRHQPGDTRAQRMTMPVSTGELTLTLSWVDAE